MSPSTKLIGTKIKILLIKREEADFDSKLPLTLKQRNQTSYSATILITDLPLVYQEGRGRY